MAKIIGIETRKEGKLFGHLEFTRLDDAAVMVLKLIDVYAATILVQIDRSPGLDILLLEHHLAKKIEDFNIVTLIVLLEIERDEGTGRVGIELYDAITRVSRNRPCLSLRIKNRQ